MAGTAGCGGADEPPEVPRVPALELVAELSEPTFLAEPAGGDGTLYVTERGGTVRAIEPDGRVRRRPVLDVSESLETEGEGGLFSIAFEPRRRWVLIAYSAPGRLVVERYDWDPATGSARARTRRELLSIPHPNPIHWGGLLAFGPDGHFYLATGEGGPVYPIPPRAQDPGSPLGKMLRVDPASGDFEVVAVGLRNPWRYSFDRETGDVWIGDVGDFTQEEVDRVPLRELDGANFGWPAREGTAPTKSDLRPGPGDLGPVLTYSRTGHEGEPRCAVTGGYVVRDPEVPSLAGRYLYGDFCQGQILSVDAAASHPEATRERVGLRVPRLASFAEDAGGRVYAISLEGSVYRLIEE